MGAAETIQAAIDKLENLRAGATPGRWVFDAEPFGAIFSEQEPDLGVETEVAEEMSDFDGTLVIVLHRTIDAQLAILRHDLEILPKYVENGLTQSWESAVERAGDLDLAHAIVGEVSR